MCTCAGELLPSKGIQPLKHQLEDFYYLFLNLARSLQAKDMLYIDDPCFGVRLCIPRVICLLIWVTSSAALSLLVLCWYSMWMWHTCRFLWYAAIPRAILFPFKWFTHITDRRLVLHSCNVFHMNWLDAVMSIWHDNYSIIAVDDVISLSYRPDLTVFLITISNESRCLRCYCNSIPFQLKSFHSIKIANLIIKKMLSWKSEINEEPRIEDRNWTELYFICWGYLIKISKVNSIKYTL